MSDRNPYEYLTTKPVFGAPSQAENERIKELEAANAFLKEQNDNLASLSRLVSNVVQQQKIADFVEFVDRHLLDDGLEMFANESDEEGIHLLIPDAKVVDGKIVRNKTNYTVTGTITYEWTVHVDATSDDDAQEIAEEFIADASASFFISGAPDGITGHDIDEYSPTVDVSDTYEN